MLLHWSLLLDNSDDIDVNISAFVVTPWLELLTNCGGSIRYNAWKLCSARCYSYQVMNPGLAKNLLPTLRARGKKNYLKLINEQA